MGAHWILPQGGFYTALSDIQKGSALVNDIGIVTTLTQGEKTTMNGGQPMPLHNG